MLFDISPKLINIKENPTIIVEIFIRFLFLIKSKIRVAKNINELQKLAKLTFCITAKYAVMVVPILLPATAKNDVFSSISSLSLNPEIILLIADELCVNEAENIPNNHEIIGIFMYLFINYTQP